jgi:hypothetical protein
VFADLLEEAGDEVEAKPIDEREAVPETTDEPPVRPVTEDPGRDPRPISEEDAVARVAAPRTPTTPNAAPPTRPAPQSEPPRQPLPRAPTTPQPEPLGAVLAGAPATPDAEPPRAPAPAPEPVTEPPAAPIDAEPSVEGGDADKVHRRPRPEPSRIIFAPLIPNHGRADRLFDVVEVFSNATTQRVTGLLVLGAEELVFVEGHPAARRGEAAPARLARLLEHAGVSCPVGPRATIALREGVEAGALDDATATAISQRHLEEGVVAALHHRGPWKFVQRDDLAISPSELVRDREDTAPLLVELLPSVAPALELASQIGGMRARVRLEEPLDVLHPRDLRFCTWLDGARALDVAAALAGIPTDRAAAIALVLIAFGRATSSARPSEVPKKEEPRVVPHNALAELEETKRLKALAELVRTSDYFTILGVDASATKADIDEAHHHLRTMIQVQAFEADATLLALAREVIRSLDEARDVLKVPELRTAYQRHLKP